MRDESIGEFIMLSEAIFRLRRSLRMTQYEFGKEIGVRQGTVGKWENGIFDPSWKMIQQIQELAKKHKKKFFIL